MKQNVKYQELKEQQEKVIKEMVEIREKIETIKNKIAKKPYIVAFFVRKIKQPQLNKLNNSLEKLKSTIKVTNSKLTVYRKGYNFQDKKLKRVQTRAASMSEKANKQNKTMTVENQTVHLRK